MPAATFFGSAGASPSPTSISGRTLASHVERGAFLRPGRKFHLSLLSNNVAQLPQIPEQSPHHREPFPEQGQQPVLVGRMLGAAGIGMRDVYRRQAEQVGEAIVRQRAAQIGEHGRAPHNTLSYRLVATISPRTSRASANVTECL